MGKEALHSCLLRKEQTYVIMVYDVILEYEPSPNTNKRKHAGHARHEPLIKIANSNTTSNQIHYHHAYNNLHP